MNNISMLQMFFMNLLGIVHELRKGVFELFLTSHLPSYVEESKGFTK